MKPNAHLCAESHHFHVPALDYLAELRLGRALGTQALSVSGHVYPGQSASSWELGLAYDRQHPDSRYFVVISPIEQKKSLT